MPKTPEDARLGGRARESRHDDAAPGDRSTTPEQDAVRFLEAVLPERDDSEVYRIEVFPPPVGLKARSKNYLSIEKMARYLVRHGQEANAYVALATFPAGGSDRKAEHALRVAVVWADVDFGEGKPHATLEDALAALEAFALKPHVVLASGHGLWAFWILAEPADGDDLDRVVRVVRGLAQVLEGDASVADKARITRVAGTVNVDSVERRKDGLDHPVELLHLNADLSRYTLDDFISAGVPEIEKGSGSRSAEGIAEDGAAIPHTQRNSTLFSLAGTMRRRGMADPEIYAALTVVNAQRCAPPLPGEEVRDIAAGITRYEPETNGAGRHGDSDRSVHLVSPPGAPLPNAELFVNERHQHGERPLLICQGNTFFRWDGACWPEVEDAALRSGLYEFFGDAEYLSEEGDGKPFNPTRYKVQDLLDALRARTHLPATVHAPAWLDGAGTVAADEIIACANGLVHVPTRTVRPLTPRFYTHYAVPFAYDPAAPPPRRWLEFLEELWSGDPESQETLQEEFGYVVSGDTSLQKIFLLVGPKRSGKGAIARVLTSMMGTHNVAGPTLASLSTNFGLSPLIGKPIAIV